MPRFTADPPLHGTFGYLPTTLSRKLPPLHRQQLQQYLSNNNNNNNSSSSSNIHHNNNSSNSSGRAGTYSTNHSNTSTINNYTPYPHPGSNNSSATATTTATTTLIKSRNNSYDAAYINGLMTGGGSFQHTHQLSLGAIQVDATTASALSSSSARYVGLITTPSPAPTSRGGRSSRPSSRPRHTNPHPLTAAAIAQNRSSVSRQTSKVRTQFNIGAPDLTPDVITNYLKQNPDVLDDFVENHVRADRIDRWMQRKTARMNTRNASSRPREADIISSQSREAVMEMNENYSDHKSAALSRWKTKLQASKGRVLQELAKDFQNANGKLLVLMELADCVSAAISADSHVLFSCDDDQQEITHISKSEDGDIVFGASERMGLGTSLSASVAYSKKTARHKDILEIKRNPDGPNVNDNKAQSVLGLPILDDKDSCLGVIEFYRYTRNSCFTKEEEEVAVLLLQWYDMLLDYVEMISLLFTLGGDMFLKNVMQTHSSMTRQRTLSDFLLEVTRSIFQDIVSMDLVIMKIMNFAKALVDADRASLFLLDTRSNELYARIFDDGNSLEEVCTEHDHLQHDEDIGSGGEGSSDNLTLESRRKREGWKKKAEKLQKDIRFSMDKGVAGYVATTGKILNIKDAYKDKRFNREVDLQTGYHTKSILCMPIFIRKHVIGVVQMVNKINGTFTKADEKAFETFAIYCGLALHHAKLYEKIRRSEQKYKVALECLSYHSMATTEEVSKLQKRTIPDTIPKITCYTFSPWAVTNDDRPLHVLFMFKKLFNNINYELDDVIRFTLTVRKNYRDVPYHNWLHAFSVAHSMFTIIETADHHLSPTEAIVLFVSCLCHDLDHRGKTNSFMVQSASPLAAIYSTSTMEHHHFNQTVSILQKEDHNIFKFLSSSEYKKALGDIKTSILATDLAVFFKNKVIMDGITKTNSFDWQKADHRNAIKAVMMTACDLCAMYKPWSTQYDLVYVIMEEFWQQGDEERKRGITPIDMMDRKKKDDLPRLEVGFIESICIPCYSIMGRIMPRTKPMLEGAESNLTKWRAMAEKLKQKTGTDV